MNYRLSLWSFAVALGLGAGGCDLIDGPDGSGGCTQIAIVSITLDVVDAQTGQPVEGAEVSFRVDDDPEVREPLESEPGRIVLAYEEVGTFHVEVGAPGYADVSRDYEVMSDEDGCHPIERVETLELQPE